MMKKLKVLIVAMVLFMGVAMYIPTVSAETTTEPTTEITTEVATADVIEMDWTELKYKIQLGFIGFLSSATFAAVVGVILNQLKKRALEKVNEAVDSNQISQAMADKATQIVNDNYDKVIVKVEQLETRNQELLDKLSESDDRVQLLLDKYEERDNQLAELIDEFGDEEDD